MNNFNKKAQTIMEGFKPIKQVRRFFYPRQFELSAEFVKAFRTEKARLMSKGHDDKGLHQKIVKALMFH